MSQKPGYHSRAHQSPYPRHSPSPVPSPSGGQSRESRYEEGRRPPRDHVQDPHGDAAAPGGDAAERGPRQTAEGGPGMTYVCIEVLGGGNGSGGEGGGRGDGVEGTNEGWHLAGGPPPGASTLAWGGSATPNPEAPNWQPSSSLHPWQGYTPSHDTRVWSSKYPYGSGRSEFAHAWCGQLQNSVYAPPTQHTPPTLPSGGPNSYIPQPVMWGREYMDQWRCSQSRNRCYPVFDGPELGKKTSTLNFLQSTTATDHSQKPPEFSKETMPLEQQTYLGELTHLDRSRKMERSSRHTSKGSKKQSNQCKGSLSTPLIPPVSQSPEPNTPERTKPENYETPVQRVLSDESFVRAPTVDRTAYFLRRAHRIRGNDKCAIEPDNAESIKPGKMIKPPKPVKPVKAFKLLKSTKPDGTLDSTSIHPLNASQNIKTNKSNQPNTSKGTKISSITPPKDVSSMNGTLTEVPIKKTLNTKHFDSLRDISPTKVTADSNTSSIFSRQVSPEKYNKSLKPNKLSVSDTFKSCDEDNTTKAKNWVAQDSNEAVRLLVPNNSLEPYQFEDLNKSLKGGDTRTVLTQNQSRENIFINEDPFKEFDTVESERGLGDTTFRKRRSPDRGKQNQRKRRLESDRKNLSECNTQDEKDTKTSESGTPSSIPRPQRSATESTFRVPQCRCHQGCPSGKQRDAAVSIGPQMCSNTTQTDYLEDLGNVQFDHLRPYSNRWHSAYSETNRPNSQMSKDPSSAVISNDATRGSGYNQFVGIDQSFDPYYPYRLPMVFQNPDTMSSMLYGGFSPDPYSNGASRFPYWGPSPFTGYGMPMPIQMAMHMCMPMGMPVTMHSASEANGAGVDTPHHVDKAVGDSREDTSILKEEDNIGKSKSRNYFSEGKDIVNLDNHTPSARKRMELLLSGLTPRGKTLHPERLNSLLSDISPDTIKKFLEDSSTSKNEDDNIIQDYHTDSSVLNNSKNLTREETISAGVEETDKNSWKRDTSHITDKIQPKEENESVNKNELKAENERLVNDNKTVQVIFISEEHEKGFVEHGTQCFNTNNQNKVEEQKEDENDSEKDKKNKDDSQKMKETGKIKNDNNVAKEQVNICNGEANNVDDYKIATSFRPSMEPIHIKIRTRPLFRNQEIRESNGNREERPTRILSVSTDTLSSTTSINPDTSVSDITTHEAVCNAASIDSPQITEIDNSTKNINECNEKNLQTEQAESIIDEKDDKVDVSVEVKPEQIEEYISTSVDTKEGNEYNLTVHYMERRYSIGPCPGVTFTSSQQTAPWNPPRMSRPTSPSRPVTVSPIRPLPRPIHPRFTATPPAPPRRRRQVTLNEGNSASAGNLRTSPRSGSLRPPRARVPARLLQATTLSTDSDAAKKSCPWSRLSFVERTALARALVDSSSCTVKVGDATVLLARSGLSSLMTIAEGILQQSRPTRTPGPQQNERRAAKSPKRSPIRVNPSPPPERKRPTTLNVANEIGVNFRDLPPKRVIIPERRIPHVKRLVNDPARSSSAGNNSVESRNSTKSGKLETKSGTKKICSAARGLLRLKGPIALTSPVQSDSTVLRKEENNSPEREGKRTARTGRYCSMRITGSSNRSESPILIPPPRGFRGRGLSCGTRGFGVVAKPCEGSSVVGKGSKSKGVNAKGDANPPWRGTKEMLFDSSSSISTVSSPKSQKKERGKITKSRSQNETKQSLVAKSKSLDEEAVFSQKSKKDISLQHEIGKPKNELSNEICLFTSIVRKCKSLAFIDNLHNKLSTSILACPKRRSSSSSSSQTLKVNGSEKIPRRTLEKEAMCCPDRLTHSGNILYRPPGYTGSRHEYELKNSEIRKTVPDEVVVSTPSRSIGTPKSTPELHVHPTNSAPPRFTQSTCQTVRTRVCADDFSILKAKRHISFADRRAHPRLPVTAVAASQRSVTRSRSHVTSPTVSPSTMPKTGDGGATAANSRTASRAQSSSPARIPVRPPTPWCDKRITNNLDREQNSSK